MSGGAPPLLDPGEVAGRLRAGTMPDPPGSDPVWPVALDDGADLAAALADAGGPPPVVLVGVVRGKTVPDPAPMDVLLTDDRGAPAPWVVVGDVDAALATLVAACRHAPGAATTLVELVRCGASLGVADGLVAESLAYAMLQAGPEHRAWLAGRRARRNRALEADPVLVDRRGEVLTVTLNRPEVHNAYDAAMRDGLVEALTVAALDPGVTRVVLHGAGPSFCSGGDLDEFGTTPDPVTAHAVRLARGAARWMARCASKTTARVHGSCIGAGVELAAFAGRVEADPATTFRLPEVAMGLVPGAGGTVSLPGRIGRERTAWLALTGTALDAGTALAWGLVDEIAPHHPAR